jgi:hypothetical protein
MSISLPTAPISKAGGKFLSYEGFFEQNSSKQVGFQDFGLRGFTDGA